MNSTVRDQSLAPEGVRKIEWVSQHMPVLNLLKKEFSKTRPFSGWPIAMSIHLEAKTAYLAYVLKEAGADVALTGSNPLSTQDDVSAGVASMGVEVHAYHGATDAEYSDHLKKTLAISPKLVLDDGGDLVHLLHTECGDRAPAVVGGCEETTTGVLRLRALAAEGKLRFPMIAVNDARCKYLFDNRHGTGQSVWDGIMRTTNLVIAGKVVTVAGYGWCGKGVALRARGLGARVVVTEIDPVKANEALMDGFDVMPMAEAAPVSDIVVTVTGCKDAVGPDHVELLKDGVLLANAGHFDVEINKPALASHSVKRTEVRRNITEYRSRTGKRIYLLAEGRLVNLASGDGHPAEIMDMSFALQMLSLLHLVEHGSDLEKTVYPVPESVDRRVAMDRLKALGVRIDRLSLDQERYLTEVWT